MSRESQAPPPGPMRTPSASTPWGAALARDPQLDAPPPVPVPIEGDEGEIIAPVSPPDGNETFPAAGATRTPAFLDTSSLDHLGDEPVVLDGYSALGSLAITNATLAASGAPTPLGGVPRHRVQRGRHALADFPDISSDQPHQFQPRFEPAEGGLPMNEPRLSADAPTPRPASTSFDDIIGTSADPIETAAPPEDQPPPSIPPESDTEVPWWRSTVALIIAALIVAGAITTVVIMVMSDNETIVAEAEVLTVIPDYEGPEPIASTDEPFASQLPLRTPTHGLIERERVELRDVDGLVVRTAYVYDLVYSDGADDVNVRAIQHFSVDEAQQAFTALVGDDAMLTDVVVGDDIVGQLATITGDDGDIIVWRNGTSVFAANGAGDLARFVELFPY